MSRSIKIAVVISLPLGAAVSIALGIFTASYTAVSADGSFQETVFGPAAALSNIQEFGLGSWLLGLLPFALTLSAAIFLGCILQAYFLGERS